MKKFNLIVLSSLILAISFCCVILPLPTIPISNRLDLNSNVICATDDDCPPGICPNGQTYQAYTCQSETNTCYQLQFFADPCQFLTSSSSGSHTKDCLCPSGFVFINNECKENKDTSACTLEYNPVCGCDGMTYGNGCLANINGIKNYTLGECESKLNQAFTGTWKGRIPKCKTLLSPKSLLLNESTGCLSCPLIQILCTPGFIGVPDTCTKCAYCARCSPRRGHISIKLCVRDENVEGIINIPQSVANGKIISSKKVSQNQIIVTISDKNENTETLILELLPTNKFLKVTFENGEVFQVKKIGQNKTCSF